MKIIYKSIFKELIITFLLCLASLNFILMMEKLLKLSRFLSGVGSSIWDMIKIILYLQPQLFLITIPMALLLSSLIAYGRMNFDNELIILRMSGLKFYQISYPVIISGIFCFIINLSIGYYIGPESSRKLREEITGIVRERTPSAIEEGNFNNIFKDILIYAKEKTNNNTIKGIFIYDNRTKDEPKILTAEKGNISAGEGFSIMLNLNNGYIHIAKKEQTTEIYFNKYNMILEPEAEAPSRKSSEMKPSEFIEKIKQSDTHNAKFIYLDLYRRFSLPVLCIVIAFLAPPLSLISGKSGRLGGLTVGLATFTFYYILLVYGENLVRAGKIPHYIGAWASTIIIGIFAILLFKRESSK
jgi:lipopolysaccharide export system permease protein